jgi:hypothetical protein
VDTSADSAVLEARTARDEAKTARDEAVNAAAGANGTGQVEGATVALPHLSRFKSLLPEDFGWAANKTLAQRTAAMKLWAASTRPGRLDPRTDYIIDISAGGLIVPATKIIEGNDAYIVDENAFGTFITLDRTGLPVVDNCYMGNGAIHGLRIRGKASAPNGINFSARGIHAAGRSYHAENTNTFPTYLAGFVLDDIIMENIGCYGMLFEYCRDFRVNNSRIYDVGYAGRMHLSCVGFRSTGNLVQDIGPGTEAPNTPSTCYGVAYTRFTKYDTDPGAGVTLRQLSLTESPRSADCVEDKWRVVNNPTYTAVDTHAGVAIRFTNGYAFNVYKGINIGHDGDDADGQGARNCYAGHNTIYGPVSGGSASSGLNLVGYTGATTVAESGLTKDCVLENNFVEGFGSSTLVTQGGAIVQGTRNAKLKGNTFNKNRGSGVSMVIGNSYAEVVGNTVIDTYHPIQAVGIGIHSTGNTELKLGENYFRKQDASLGTLVMTAGYFTENFANSLRFIGGDQFEGTMTKYSIQPNVVLRGNPTRQAGTQSITIAGGAAANTVTFNWPEAFTVAPRSVTVSGPSFLDTLPLIIGVSNITATACTITARTPNNGSVGATGGTIVVNYVAEGY